MPLLNLTDYDEQSFDALPAGRYYAEVFEIEERQTKNDGATPAGTDMIWVHFKITGKVGEDDGPNEESPYYNRRAFVNLVIPPEGHDAKKAKTMNGRIVSLFKAFGVPEEEIASGNFEPDLDDYFETELVVQLSRRKDDSSQNNVQGFKSMEEVQGSAGTRGLI